MHHPRAGHFQPPGLLADPAALALAEDAVHVHFDAGLGERKVAAPDAHLPVFPVHLAGEFANGADQVGDADPVTHRQPLHLEELVLGAGRDLLVAVALAGQDDPDGMRMLLTHAADLSRRGMGAEHHLLVDPDGVPHVPRRMVRRNVQQLEIVLVRLHLRRLVYLEPHLGENLPQPAQRARAQMEMARCDGTSRQGDIQRFLGQGGFQLGLADRRLPRGEVGLQTGLDLVGEPPHLRAILRGELSQTAEQVGELTAPPQEAAVPIGKLLGAGKFFQRP